MSDQDKSKPTTPNRRGVMMGMTAAALTPALFRPSRATAATFPTAEVNTTGLAVHAPPTDSKGNQAPVTSELKLSDPHG